MLEKIEKPELETVELRSDGKYGKFVLAPLERGYGTTLGNSLRRVLLSSLPGVAVNSVKIDGVHHELSTIPGVKEDVTEIILSLKGLTAKLYGDGPKTIYIEAEGECEVTAGDINIVHTHDRRYFVVNRHRYIFRIGTEILTTDDQLCTNTSTIRRETFENRTLAQIGRCNLILIHGS